VYHHLQVFIDGAGTQKDTHLSALFALMINRKTSKDNVFVCFNKYLLTHTNIEDIRVNINKSKIQHKDGFCRFALEVKRVPGFPEGMVSSISNKKRGKQCM